MIRKVTALLVVVLAALSGAPFAWAKEAPSKSDSSSLYQSLAKGNNTFAVQLYGELAHDSGNLFFSPYGISTALGMTYAGARGNTAKEMKEALHFQLDRAGLDMAFKGLSKEMTTVAERSGQKLNIANGLSITGGDVSKEFKAILHDDYDAELFSGGLEQINDWVARKTEGKIKKILDQLDPNSVCVILNAIYFKGLWQSQFSKDHTRNEPFNVSAAKQVTAPLMYQRGDFKLMNEKDFQAVSIPYKGDDISMVVMLPKTTDGLAGLEKQLTSANLQDWLGGLDSQPVLKIDLYLPKFTVESGYDLKSPFMKMGIREAFGEGADFSGMGARKGEIWIGQIKHKGFVEVNEEGTEAAAGTAVEMVTKSAPIFPVFRADHPFLFLVRDNHAGTILFMGRIVDPTVK
jgi:serpin B